MSKSPPPVRLIKPFEPDAILCGISWFKEAVRDIRVFKVEDWSDFTNIVKQS